MSKKTISYDDLKFEYDILYETNQEYYKKISELKKNQNETVRIELDQANIIIQSLREEISNLKLELEAVYEIKKEQTDKLKKEITELKEAIKNNANIPDLIPRDSELIEKLKNENNVYFTYLKKLILENKIIIDDTQVIDLIQAKISV